MLNVSITYNTEWCQLKLRKVLTMKHTILRGKAHYKEKILGK
jgi:hypothetical protein